MSRFALYDQEEDQKTPPGHLGEVSPGSGGAGESEDEHHPEGIEGHRPYDR